VGTRLPTVRALAGELGLAVNTVARSYRELEAAGVVETRGRAGTVVASSGDAMRLRLAEAAGQYVELARGSGVTADEAIAIVSVAFDAAGPV
jgi:DNA-binding transcriptional regulator YhcF (GntR family)